MILAYAEQMRELDRQAIGERGVSSAELMENAARAVVQAVLRLAGEALPVIRGVPMNAEVEFPREKERRRTVHRAAVFCGCGNNGGDGVAAARFLREAGWSVRAFLVGKREKMTPDTIEMERRLQRAGGELEDFLPGSVGQLGWIEKADVLVDALFGIGLKRNVTGDFAAAVAYMNAAPAPTAAVDIASGVDADTGRVLGTAVEAAVTVTFTRAKPGHFIGRGGLLTGELDVAGIGVPAELAEKLRCDVRTIERPDVSLPRRPRDAHKGDFGRVCILGGCVGYSGAPVLAAKAAVRTGAGLVTVLVPKPVWPVSAARLDTAMPWPLPADETGALAWNAREKALEKIVSADASVLGPGLSRAAGAADVVRYVLSHTDRPVILDADGINALEGHIDVLDARRGTVTVLTPHDGEFARLGGNLSSGDRLGAARVFAAAHGCILVLKGHRTITAFPDGEAWINTTGNPGMAKGGSGDVLSGMTASLLAQGLPAKKAVPWAVWLHGAAGDLAAADLGEYAMTPADLIEKLPAVTKQF